MARRRPGTSGGDAAGSTPVARVPLPSYTFRKSPTRDPASRRFVSTRGAARRLGRPLDGPLAGGGRPPGPPERAVTTRQQCPRRRVLGVAATGVAGPGGCFGDESAAREAPGWSSTGRRSARPAGWCDVRVRYRGAAGRPLRSDVTAPAVRRGRGPDGREGVSSASRWRYGSGPTMHRPSAERSGPER